MGINPIVVTVSIILQLQGGNIVGTASGFFYTHDDQLFLVTNKHVMTESQSESKPEALRLRLHTDPNDLTKNANFDVPLYKNNEPLWKIHSWYPDADIALIKLVKNQLESRFFIKAWSKEDFLPKHYRIDPGEDVFVMGYPLSFHDIRHNLPVFRNAMLASTFRVPFWKLPLVLVDANLHPGNSGSPVITKPKSTWVDEKGNTHVVIGTVYYLIGVHSGTIDSKLTGGEPIGLGAAWYAELIEDMVASF